MMNRKWLRLSAAVLIVFMMMMLYMTPKAEPEFGVQASAMALIEYETGEMIAKENCDTPLPMASTTKIMTALVVLESCDIDEYCDIPDEAVGVEGSSIYLQKGERMKVRDLLYGLMLSSGNDAAVALAVHVGGSVEGFADMMNERAKRLGLTKTHFVTPNGLSAEGHYTTAYELCLTAREAMQNAAFREIVSSKYYTAESGEKVRTFKNKNSLLWNYEGALGIKTGYTMAAGRCLVFSAERNGMTVIGAVLNCRPMFETAEKLMDYAFLNYCVETVVAKGTQVKKINIENSVESILEVETKGSIIALMQRGEERSFRTEVKLYGLSAPIEKGETVGKLLVYDGEKLIGETELAASYSIHVKDFGFWLKLIASVFAS